MNKETKNSVYFNYDVPAGESIDRACVNAIDMAIKNDANIIFNFNGTEVIANKNSDARDLINGWEDAMERSARQYEESTEGIAEAIRREEEVKTKQARIRELMGEIGPLLDSMSEEEIFKAFLAKLNETLVENTEEDSPDSLMDWLYSFAEIADDIRLEFNKYELAKKLEDAGFVHNQYVGNSPEWFNTRQRMARYIVGQVIDCLLGGMPPHPVTMTFIEKYRELPKG